MKLFLLDAYALIYRAHFAFIKRPLINSKGVNVSAVSGFINTLWELIQQEKPTHLAVGFDLSGGTFRNEIFPEYKANRQEQPEDITIAVPYIKQILEAWNIPVLAVQGFEADDVICAIAKQAVAKNFEVYMVTPDKDYGQAVQDGIYLYKPGRQGNEHEIWGPKEVCANWNISRPEQVIDILALQGDSVDNIPGVPGVGPKTAADLLRDWDSVENLLANLDNIKNEKVREKIRANADKAILSKTLATIDLNVPIVFDEAHCALTTPEVSGLSEIFKELEFRSLAQKIISYYQPSQAASKTSKPAGQAPQMSLFGESPETQSANFAQQQANADLEPEESRVNLIAEKNIGNTPHQYTLVSTPEQRAELIATLSGVTEFCFDTETTGIDATNVELVGMSFSIKSHEGWYVPIPSKQSEAQSIVNEFKGILENEKTTKIGQNIKYDVLVLKSYGVEVGGTFQDTMVMHYLLEPDKRHGMDYLSETYLGYAPVSIETLIGKKGKNQLTMRDVPVAKVSEYAAEDADITLQLRNVLMPKFEPEVLSLYLEMEEPLIHVLADIEAEGIRVDADFLNEYSSKLEAEINTLQKAIYEQAGVKDVNLNAPGQVGTMLFEHLKIPYRWKKTKMGAYSTDEEILTELSFDYPLVKEILEFRSLQKLKGTYVDALPRLVNPRTGRVHTTFRQTVAQTGRLSSDNPNLQNIPVRSEAGKQVRKAFIPRDADHTLISADYSQIELRLIAEIARDEAMLTAFQNGQDIHAATAAKIFNVPLEEVTKEQRYQAKTINFSIIYGAGAVNLSRALSIKTAEAKAMIDAYFVQYNGLKRYMEETVNFARDNGYVTTLRGRRRYLRDINSRNGLTRSNEERMAINTPIQGSAADMIKLAMIAVHKALKEGGFATRMILQVHDELIFDAPKNEVEKVTPIILECMQNALPGLLVPIEVGIGKGDNWLEAH